MISSRRRSGSAGKKRRSTGSVQNLSELRGTLARAPAFWSAVLGKTAGRHTSAEFVAFLAELVSGQPKKREIHVIVDNLSAHKTERVQLFLQEHSQVKLHFTPTYSSWLNQVELWFSKIERDVIARGVFSSVKDLSRKIMRYIRHYNRQAKPVKWSYKNTRNRIRPESDSNVTVH